MALYRNLSDDLKAQRDALVAACAAHVDVNEEYPDGQDPFFEARAAVDEFDELHGLDHRAEDIMERLSKSDVNLNEGGAEWTVIDIHDLVSDALGDDLDLEDVDLFQDLLCLFNSPGAA